MKKSILILIFGVFLISTGNLYAKNDNSHGKSSDRGERSSDRGERSSDRGGRSSDRGKKSESDRKSKNEKAVDAQKNWGKLKGDVEYADKYEKKEIKEEIKVKKRIRREVRKNPDLDLTEEDIEQLIADYMATENPVAVEVNNELTEDPAAVDEPLNSNIEKALSKYKAALERIDLKRQEEVVDSDAVTGDAPADTAQSEVTPDIDSSDAVQTETNL